VALKRFWPAALNFEHFNQLRQHKNVYHQYFDNLTKIRKPDIYEAK
jgi:hypothetical protein